MSTANTIARGIWSGVESMSTPQKLLLSTGAVAAYVVALCVFSLAGMPALPRFSALLLQGEPAYALPLVGVMLVFLTFLTRPVVGGVRYDAPLFCAAVGLLALPTHGGDFRYALLDATGPGVYLKMVLELLLLSAVVAVGYVALFVGRRAPAMNPDSAENLPPAKESADDSAVDRLAAVAIQTVVILAMLSFLGKSPLKGQSLCGLALASGLASWITYKTRQVEGSIWATAGTLLAGLIAYVWSYFNPAGFELGDVQHALAGATYSLPMHYATAGVAGAIYGYWAGRAGADAA